MCDIGADEIFLGYEIISISILYITLWKVTPNPTYINITQLETVSKFLQNNRECTIYLVGVCQLFSMVYILTLQFLVWVRRIPRAEMLVSGCRAHKSH